MTEKYFENGKDYEVPAMNDPVDSGVLRDANGVVLATFASAAHALVSLYLHKFSVEQIKVLIPGITNLDKNLVTKIMHDTCKREVRKDFIKSLHGNLPRQLTINEYDNVVNYVGVPMGKPKGIGVDEMTEALKLDIENVDFIKPEKKTPVVNAAAVSGKIAKNEKKIEKLNKKLEAANAKMTKLNEAEASQQINYKKIKMNKTIRLIEATIADLVNKNGVLQSKLNGTEYEVTEKSEN